MLEEQKLFCDGLNNDVLKYSLKTRIAYTMIYSTKISLRY